MILIYENPNLHSFPLKQGLNAEKKPIFKTFTFLPGKNEIASKVWERIYSEYKKTIDYMIHDSGELIIFEKWFIVRLTILPLYPGTIYSSSFPIVSRAFS